MTFTGTSITDSALLDEVDWLSQTLIAVSTGGPRIESVNTEYKRRYAGLTADLRERGLGNPIPYDDLWQWYGKWSGGELPTYQSRRNYIHDLIEPMRNRILAGSSGRAHDVFGEPTGWDRVDRTLEEVRTRLASASTEEQFQAVGLLCREALISVAQAAFDPDQHPPPDGVKASKTDAKRMLEGFLAAEMAGSTNSVSRKYAKSVVELALELQHQRTADFQKAALCAEATASVINVISILAGVRDADGTGGDNDDLPFE